MYSAKQKNLFVSPPDVKIRSWNVKLRKRHRVYVPEKFYLISSGIVCRNRIRISVRPRISSVHHDSSKFLMSTCEIHLFLLSSNWKTNFVCESIYIASRKSKVNSIESRNIQRQPENELKKSRFLYIENWSRLLCRQMLGSVNHNVYILNIWTDLLLCVNEITLLYLFETTSVSHRNGIFLS